MVWSPVLASRRTSSILVSTEMLLFSFCKPSRGPTSTMRTWSARLRLDVASERFESCRFESCRYGRRQAVRQDGSIWLSLMWQEMISPH